MRRCLLLALLGPQLLSACVESSPSAPPLTGLAPLAPELRLPRSGSPEAQGVSSASIATFLDELEQTPAVDEVNSLMLLRHGQVVAEGWWAPYRASDVHTLYSVSKSFNSTAAGFAIAEGLLSEQDTVASFFPEYVPAEPSANLMGMRIAHLLTMSTGHQTDTIDRIKAAPEGQWLRQFFQLPVEREPGSFFLYNSGASYVLSAIVEKITQMSVAEYLQPRLFDKLGIRGPATAGGVIWGKSPEGVSLGDGGLALKTEDLAKFGLLFLQGGTFDEQAVLPTGWAETATESHISTGNRDGNWNWGYGYNFWRNAESGYRADGSLGQFVFVYPEYDVVLAMTSATASAGMDALMTLVRTRLLPTLSEEPLPEDPAALESLRSRLASLTLPLASGAADGPLAAQVSGQRFALSDNPQGLQALTLDWQATPPTLTLEDATGSHALPLGLNGWLQTRTDFNLRVNELFELTPDQGLATSAAWLDDDTLQVRLSFNETPYALTQELTFSGTEVALAQQYNIRWGDRVLPAITGQVAP